MNNRQHPALACQSGVPVESLFDGICFFFVLTIVEYAIMIPMGRFSKKNTERVDFWLQNWEQENDE